MYKKPNEIHQYLIPIKIKQPIQQQPYHTLLIYNCIAIRNKNIPYITGQWILS